MAPIPPLWLLLWPLRQAAVIPAVLIGSVVFGGAVGAFDLSRRVTSLAFPVRTRRSGTRTVAWSAAITAGGGIVAIREFLFRPPTIPPPGLPVDASVPLVTRLKHASIISMHTVVHYPYVFRFTNAMLAGGIAGVAYVAAERMFNADGGIPATPATLKVAAKSPQPKASVAPVSIDDTTSVRDIGGFAADVSSSEAPPEIADNDPHAFAGGSADKYASNNEPAAASLKGLNQEGVTYDRDPYDSVGQT